MIDKLIKCADIRAFDEYIKYTPEGYLREDYDSKSHFGLLIKYIPRLNFNKNLFLKIVIGL